MYQSVLVTGASSGIGEACALHLAHKGFRVYAAARRVELLRNLEGLAGGRITSVALDVTDQASIKNALTRINDDGASLFGLVNNAGMIVMGPVETTPVDEWKRQYETNVFGLVQMIQAVLPGMRAAGKGRIVNIGSVAGRVASPFQGAYASSKHAVEGVSDSLRREVAPFGIQVSLVRPGFINTAFGEHGKTSLEPHTHADEPYAEHAKTFMEWRAKGHPNAPGPMIVAEAVHDALTANKPRAYYAAPPKTYAALAMRKFLPARLTDHIMARVMGGN